MKRILSVIVFACVVAPTSSFAQSYDLERDVLRAIDTIPTRAFLDDNFANVRDQLEEAAVVSDESYTRDRAITLMSLYPDLRTQSFLISLLDDERPTVRRMAVYTLGRTFGPTADADLAGRVIAMTRDPDRRVADLAVRALRYVADPAAIGALRELSSGPTRLSRIANHVLRDLDAVAP